MVHVNIYLHILTFTKFMSLKIIYKWKENVILLIIQDINKSPVVGKF